jgi:predicted RNase H-like nuclease (RuvC/YqgF family)
MSNEKRLERLEEKVDNLKDNMTDLSSDFRQHTTMIEGKLELFQQHVESDSEVIKELKTFSAELPAIKEIAEEFKFKKQLEKRAISKLKKTGAVLGLVSIVLGIGASFLKIFGK